MASIVWVREVCPSAVCPPCLWAQRNTGATSGGTSVVVRHLPHPHKSLCQNVLSASSRIGSWWTQAAWGASGCGQRRLQTPPTASRPWMSKSSRTVSNWRLPWDQRLDRRFNLLSLLSTGRDDGLDRRVRTNPSRQDRARLKP